MKGGKPYHLKIVDALLALEGEPLRMLSECATLLGCDDAEHPDHCWYRMLSEMLKLRRLEERDLDAYPGTTRQLQVAHRDHRRFEMVIDMVEEERGMLPDETAVSNEGEVPGGAEGWGGGVDRSGAAAD